MEDDERRLWAAKAEGEKGAREQLIMRFLPLARFWAAKLAKILGLDMQQDFYQIACCGLAIAVDRFDFTQGWEFSTYARYWIRNKIFKSNE